MTLCMGGTIANRTTGLRLKSINCVAYCIVLNYIYIYISPEGLQQRAKYFLVIDTLIVTPIEQENCTVQGKWSIFKGNTIYTQIDKHYYFSLYGQL